MRPRRYSERDEGLSRNRNRAGRGNDGRRAVQRNQPVVRKVSKRDNEGYETTLSKRTILFTPEQEEMIKIAMEETGETPQRFLRRAVMQAVEKVFYDEDEEEDNYPRGRDVPDDMGDDDFEDVEEDDEDVEYVVGFDEVPRNPSKIDDDDDFFD